MSDSNTENSSSNANPPAAPVAKKNISSEEIKQMMDKIFGSITIPGLAPDIMNEAKQTATALASDKTLFDAMYALFSSPEVRDLLKKPSATQPSSDELKKNQQN